MSRQQQAQRDMLISKGVQKFLDTLSTATGTRAAVVTVQPDGFTQFHSSLKEPDLTKHLMRIAAGDREGATIQ